MTNKSRSFVCVRSTLFDILTFKVLILSLFKAIVYLYSIKFLQIYLLYKKLRSIAAPPLVNHFFSVLAVTIIRIRLIIKQNPPTTLKLSSKLSTRKSITIMHHPLCSVTNHAAKQHTAHSRSILQNDLGTIQPNPAIIFNPAIQKILQINHNNFRIRIPPLFSRYLNYSKIYSIFQIYVNLTI